MRFLLDTHTLLWAALSKAKLSRTAASRIADPQNMILVSAASAWEISTKVRLGKFPEAASFEIAFIQKIDEAGYELVPIEVSHALRAGRMVGEHGDPFDRMIAAQALAMDIPVISIDPKLDAFGIRRIW